MESAQRLCQLKTGKFLRRGRHLGDTKRLSERPFLGEAHKDHELKLLSSSMLREVRPEHRPEGCGESAYKPGSVENSHSSGTHVTVRLKQPTRKHTWATRCCLLTGSDFPIWPCSRWGLPCRAMLPPTRCALTAPFHPYHEAVAGTHGGLLSVALSVGSRPPGVTWHLARWSPDFPPCLPKHTQRLSSRLSAQAP
jgi:hypothetical protein